MIHRSDVQFVQRPDTVSRRPRKASASIRRWRELNHLREVIAPTLKPSESWVLFVIFSMADARSKTARVSHSAIAKRSGLSRRHIIRIVKRLIKKGHIHRIHAGRSSRTTNIYKYCW
jgi:DNA-binding MarR family transcriptional regulator